MDKVFQSSQCLKKEKINYVVYLSWDSAHYLWKPIERNRVKDEDPFTWAKFHEEFFAKHFPSSKGASWRYNLLG